jgi:hypothetical protein
MKKLTDGRRMDEGRQVMAIPHMTLWIRWAKNETESTDEESTSSETTVVPQVPTSNSFLPLSDAKENTKEETNLNGSAGYKKNQLVLCKNYVLQW